MKPSSFIMKLPQTKLQNVNTVIFVTTSIKNTASRLNSKAKYKAISSEIPKLCYTMIRRTALQSAALALTAIITQAIILLMMMAIWASSPTSINECMSLSSENSITWTSVWNDLKISLSAGDRHWTKRSDITSFICISSQFVRVIIHIAFTTMRVCHLPLCVYVQSTVNKLKQIRSMKLNDRPGGKSGF